MRTIVRLVLIPGLLSLAVTLCAQSGEDDPTSPAADGLQPDWIHSTNTGPEAPGDWIQAGSAEPTIPSVGEQAVATLRAEAFSGDLGTKSRVIAALSELQADHQLSPDDRAAIDLISFLATESYDYQIRRDGRVINDFPMIRAGAVQLLGSVGGPAAIATLQHVLTHEEDEFVLSQAVTAVAQAAPGPSPELLSTLTMLVNRMNAVRRPDNALALSVIYAVEDLHERSTGIDDPDMFRALISIAQGGYSTAVRRAAVRVIDTLRRQPQP